MRKIVIMLVALSLVLTLTACAQTQEGTSSTLQDSSSAGWRILTFDSIEDFMAFMERTDFDKKGFFSDYGGPFEDGYYETYYMLRADKFYYVPRLNAENVKKVKAYIQPGGFIGFEYYIGDDENPSLTIRLLTSKQDKLTDGKGSLQSAVEERYKGFAPNVTFSPYTVRGNSGVISSSNEIFLAIDDEYIADMRGSPLPRENSGDMLDYKYDGAAPKYAEMVTFERVSLK